MNNDKRRRRDGEIKPLTSHFFLCLSLQKYDDDKKRHVENELEKNKHCIWSIKLFSMLREPFSAIDDALSDR